MKKRIILTAAALLPLCLSADNLLHNSSFELGSSDFSILRLSDQEMEYRKPIADSKEKIHGNYSLKIENPQGNCIQMTSREFFLKAGENYTFSWYIKSSEQLQLRVGIIGETEKKWNIFKKNYNITSGKWKRYHYTFRPSKEGWYFLELRWGQMEKKHNPAEVNLDALMISSGKEPGAYKPLAEREFALIAPGKRLAEKGKPFSVTFLGIDYSGKKGTVPVSLTMQDRLSGKVISTQKSELKFDGNSPVRQEFSFLPEKNGIYEISSDHDTVSIGFGKVKNLSSAKIDLRQERGIGCDFPGSTHNPANMAYFPVTFVSSGYSFDDYFSFAAASGLKILRVGNIGNIFGGAFSWRKMEPEEGKFDFSCADLWLAAANRHGMVLFPVLGNMFYLRDNVHFGKRSISRLPKFVVERAKRISKPKQPWDNLEIQTRDYQRLTEAITAHFKGKIQAYELSNEPNICVAAEKYAELSKSAAEIIHRIDPAAVVVGGCITEDYNGRSSYLLDLIRLGSAVTYDALSFHPYRSRLDSSKFPAEEHIRKLRERVDSVKPGMYLWNSELYYLVDTPNWRMQINGNYQMKNIKPEFLVRRLAIDFGEGVMQSMPLHLDMMRLMRSELQPHWSLDCRYVGNALIPNEIFIAHNNASSWFTACIPLEKYQWPKGYTGYRFRHHDGKEFSVVWCHPGTESKEFSASGERFDLFGNKLPNKGKTLLTPIPQYVSGKVILE